MKKLILLLFVFFLSLFSFVVAQDSNLVAERCNYGMDYDADGTIDYCAEPPEITDDISQPEIEQILVRTPKQKTNFIEEFWVFLTQAF